MFQAKVKMQVVLGEFKCKRAASIHYPTIKYFSDITGAQDMTRIRLNREIALIAPAPKSTNIGGNRYLSGQLKLKMHNQVGWRVLKTCCCSVLLMLDTCWAMCHSILCCIS